MANTSSRSLQLLSLLQRRRFWPGNELAERLEVSERTVRRDVERLRDLGYPIASVRGVEGGYRFEAGATLPPLQFDGDEAVALTLALRTAASAADPALAEAAAGALAKIMPVLPPAVRTRAEAVQSMTDTGPDERSWTDRASPSLSVLAVVAQSCRDGVRLSFEYSAADGVASSCYVEPYRLVTVGRRWYLLAFDVDRDDWRTFRLDRITEPRPARTPFTSRPLPGDPHRYVSERLRALSPAYQVVVDIDLPATELAEELGAWCSIESTGDSGARSRVSFETQFLDWPLVYLARLGAPIKVIEPPELREAAARLVANLTTASPATGR